MGVSSFNPLSPSPESVEAPGAVEQDDGTARQPRKGQAQVGGGSLGSGGGAGRVSRPTGQKDFVHGGPWAGAAWGSVPHAEEAGVLLSS